MQNSSGNDSMMSEINVTPFVDVMLVLLIIFMVAAPLIQQQVDVDLPETASKQEVAVKANDIVLVINKRQELSIENTRIPLEQLPIKIEAIFKNKKKKELFLQADQSIPYGFVVKIMALVKNAGVAKMGMITDSDQS